jgi:hypothetical protein
MKRKENTLRINLFDNDDDDNKGDENDNDDYDNNDDSNDERHLIRKQRGCMTESMKRKENISRINLYHDDDDVHLDKLVERCENRHDDDVYLDKLVEM